MNAGPLVTTDYHVAAPYDAIEAVEPILIERGFVVVEEDGEYLGLLSPADVLLRPHVLVADTVTPKLIIDWDTPIPDVLHIMEGHGVHAAPVFRMGRFAGVLRYGDLVSHLFERQRRIDRHAHKIDRYEALSLLAAGVGHDFNNLLHAALVQVDLLARCHAGDSEEGELVDGLARALSRATSLSKQLLTFSRTSSPRRAPCDLEAVVASIVPFFLKGTRVEAVFDFPADLVPVLLDESMFSQVVSNLTLNAVQAMPDGGRLCVSATACELGEEGPLLLPPGRYVCLSFRDAGSGIPEDLREKIFDPYFTTKPSGEGLGLGLALVRSIVRKHDGDMQVVSQPGSGADFRLYLPAA